MTKFHYRKESSIISGVIFRPVAEITLGYKNQTVEAVMYIDSGADITMVPLEVGKALGLKQNPDDEILEIKGVSGSGVPYILKKATLIINGKRLSIRLAWALIEEVPLLLGRMDIFNKFRIIFDEKKKLVIFNNSI